MKKIVRGLRYDTEAPRTACLGASGGGSGYSRWEAALYKTGGGRFFLAGEGGPSTMFRSTVEANQWSGGNDIIPMTAEEALEWAE
ncbi:MAG: hypothetical protein KKC78_16340 [Proteobacteria bacterium]|nr:hypothetical protein [Pseudomonadota bacterium]